MKHDAFCNVVRFSCPSCGLYRSYCLSHQEPTSANRCSCQERHNKHSKRNRELSFSELSCPIRGCSLGANHNGPCIPRHADEETTEIREANLILLSRDDPEGFRMKIRELLGERNETK